MIFPLSAPKFDNIYIAYMCFLFVMKQLLNKHITDLSIDNWESRLNFGGQSFKINHRLCTFRPNIIAKVNLIIE